MNVISFTIFLRRNLTFYRFSFMGRHLILTSSAVNCLFLVMGAQGKFVIMGVWGSFGTMTKLMIVFVHSLECDRIYVRVLINCRAHNFFLVCVFDFFTGFLILP